MVTDKCERYAIAHVPEGLQISLWQALPRLGFGVIVLVILTACFLTDPYQGHGRIWAGLGVVALALVALFGVRVESWIISDCAIRYKRSLWSGELLSEHSPGGPLIVWVEHVPCDREGTQPPFPHVVHLMGPSKIEIGNGFEFRERSTLARFLKILDEVAPIEVTDLQSGNEYEDKSEQPFSGTSDRWADRGD
jgi:hypothetical protein